MGNTKLTRLLNGSTRPDPFYSSTPGYTDIDKIETRINNNVERMINANTEKIMRMMTEQFF